MMRVVRFTIYSFVSPVATDWFDKFIVNFLFHYASLKVVSFGGL